MLKAASIRGIAPIVALIATLAACTGSGHSPHAPSPATSPSPAVSVLGDASSAPTSATVPVVTAADTSASPEPVPVPTVRAAGGAIGPPGVAREVDGAWVVGDGDPDTCTSAALVRATRKGGDVTFDCGPEQWTIVLEETLTVCNTVDCAPDGAPIEHLRLDGGGKVVIAGTGERQLLYANSCEARLGVLPGACERRTTPHLLLERLSLVGGSASEGSGGAGVDLGGGGALAMRGGQLTMSDVMLSGNGCGTDRSAAGGALLLVDAGAPAWISGATFAANRCGIGGAIALRSTPATIVGANVVDNVATDTGGGIHATGSGTRLDVALTTVSGNSAAAGSGIEYEVTDGALTLRQARVEGNLSDVESTPVTEIRSDSTVTDENGEVEGVTVSEPLPPAPTEPATPAPPADAAPAEPAAPAE